MRTIKTVVENKHLAKILDLLDEAGVLVNTIKIEDKKEKKVFQNIFKTQYTLLHTTCQENQKEYIVNKIFPIITLIGGICIS